MAGKIKGITITLGADVQPLNKALEGVNKKSRDLQGELRQVDRLLKLDPSNTTLVAQKQELLSKAISNTKEKLDTLREAERQVQEQFKRGEIGEEQYRAFQREVVKAEQELKKFEKQLRETGITAEQLGKKLDDAGKKMTDVGKNLSKKVTAPLVGLGAVATKLGMDFEAAMSEVGAISGATGEDLEKLEALAREMGATTKFSASEAAEGLKYMAMAGWDTQQQLDGLPGVLNLAAASGESLGTVSDIVTDAMTAFGMEASQAGEFADILAAASSNANTNVGMLGESFKYVAPVAGALGFEAKDTATALGLMANAGIKSSQAGTALRTMLTNLAKPTKEMQKAMDKYGISLTNTDGSMKSLDEVMLNLRESLGGLTEAEQAAAAATIFGKEAMSGALAIVNASEEDFNKLSHAINNSAGAAQKMADEMQDNLKGRLTELKSAIEGVALQLYDHLQPALEKIVEVVQKLVDWFADLSPETQKVIVVIAGLAAAIGPLLIVLGQMSLGLSSIIKLIGPLTTGLTGATGATGGLSAVIAALTGPIGIAVAAIVGITAVIVALWKTNEDFRDGLKRVWENIKQIIDGVIKVIKGIIQAFIGLITGDWTKFTEGLKNIWSGMWQAIRNIVAGAWNLLSTVFNTLKNNITNFFTGMVRSAVDWGKNVIQGFINGIKSMISSVGRAIGGIADTVTGGISKALKIRSPSRVMEELGKNTAEGFALGIKSALNEVTKQTQALTAIPGTGSTVQHSTYTTNHIDFNGLFAGANFYVRNDSDIKRIAKELHHLQQNAMRGRGLAPV